MSPRSSRGAPGTLRSREAEPPRASPLRPSPSRDLPRSAIELAATAARQPATAAEGGWAPAPAAPRPLPAPGSVIAGRYRLDRVLQVGGMGAVLKARDLRLETDVALKFVRSDMSSAEAVERLYREARATARISHPSVVRILDVNADESDGAFLVMELLQGPTLADTLAARAASCIAPGPRVIVEGACPAFGGSAWAPSGGHLTPEEAILLMLPVLGAVAAAHAEGIVHRDIKPQNVMLVEESHGAVVPKLIDFGVARVLAEPASTRITRAGALIGSPEYMAPEQARGSVDVDAQADVWAIAVLLYELVAGTTPFRRSTPLATLGAIVSDEAACPDALREEPALWAIVRRGLAKERPPRWSSARELGQHLAAWALERGFEADAAGTALAATWLGKRRMLLPARRRAA